MVFKSYMNKAEKNYTSPDKVIPASFVQVSGNVTDHAQGPLMQTENELDIAIDGKGFFLVDNGEGLKVTRNGSMIVGEDGFLKTKDGYNVMGLKNGKAYGPINVGIKREITFSSEGNILMKENGTFSDEKVLMEKMVIVNVADISKLEKVKGGYFKVTEEELIDRQENPPTIKQGFLEKSNVNTIEEMTQLISLTRNFESNQKVIQAVDEMDSQAIEKLGSV
jgi:flagellar basal-body rod protein FlgG